MSIVPSKVTKKRLEKLYEKHYIKLMCVSPLGFVIPFVDE
jgi:hypothetical protein